MNASGRTVLFVLGVMLASLSAAMFAPAIADLNDDAQAAHAFFGAGGLGLALGGIMTLMGRGSTKDLSARGAILLTGGAWIVLSVAAAIPLKLSGLDISWTDALFEATSGLTTTGATVLTGLQDMPAGILLWRSILQWIGGVGIIVTAMAIWPLLGIGGMQLFRLESSDKSEKALPRAGQIAGAVGGIYLVLTFLCFLAYLGADMTPFEAINHAMTTVATGGFSTHDGSIGAFVDGGADLVALVFMVLAGLPFVLFLRAAQGRPDLLVFDPQARAFLIVALTASILLTLWLVVHDPHDPAHLPAWRIAAVNGVSVLTGTGYASADFWLWGGGAAGIFFVLMFIGGCAGSTTCSVKIFRYQIAASAMNAYIAQYARPNAVKPIRYRNQTVPDETVRSVLGFFFLFFLTFGISASLLSLIGLDPVTAVSGAATTLANVGPGLGEIIGPAGSFHDLPATAKWVMTANMIIGRLEIMVIFVMLAPRFWRG
ncbi:TrkH family potassium uptake protein [Oceanicaulis sp.]|uniref:TrkH family potassium uptake protein n=1 Tax=Oceanicaulis sp. TaxID=1924941 RepID=UPI003D2DE4DC